MATAKKTKPALWARAKAQAKAKMGGKHSARAMQLAVKIYKKAGGGYRGSKSARKTNYQNGANKNGKQAVVKSQKAKEDTFQKKHGKLSLQKRRQLQTELKQKVIKKVNNLLNNRKVLQQKQKGIENENNK
jgi:hypothetical protein